MKKIKLPNIGEILEKEFMKPFNISAEFLADSIGVSSSRILDIVCNNKRIDIELSIRLGKFFGFSNTYFINLQNDLDSRKIMIKNGESINKIQPIKTN